MMSTPDILAENLLSDEEHNSFDGGVTSVAKALMALTSMENPDELDKLIFIVVAALLTAPPKANLCRLSEEEVRGILKTDPKVYETVQEAERRQAFRNVRNLSKSLP